MWKVIDARKSEKLRKAGGGEHPKSGHAYKVRRRSPNKSHLRGATETAQKWKEAAFLQSYWGNPNLTQLIPSCPDVPFSRHSRFHPSPFHPLPYPDISQFPTLPVSSFYPFLIAHGTIYSPEITGLPTAGQSIAIQPSLRDTTSSTRENYVDFFLWHKKTFVTIYLNL